MSRISPQKFTQSCHCYPLLRDFLHQHYGAETRPQDTGRRKPEQPQSGGHCPIAARRGYCFCCINRARHGSLKESTHAAESENRRTRARGMLQFCCYRVCRPNQLRSMSGRLIFIEHKVNEIAWWRRRHFAVSLYEGSVNISNGHRRNRCNLVACARQPVFARSALPSPLPPCLFQPLSLSPSIRRTTREE